MSEFGRMDYALGGLDESDLTLDPLDLFTRWYDQAATAVEEPNAMVLSTTAQGRPSSRTVLLKGLSDEGFVFYTNYASRKAVEISADPACALLFPWYALQRQVRVEGKAEQVDRATTEAYFASRPRSSQLGAWASVEPVAQSGVVPDRAALQAAYDAAEAAYDGSEVPCPPTWGGYLVRPSAIEFWQGRSGRMHDRLRYRRDTASDTGWIVERLSP